MGCREYFNRKKTDFCSTIIASNYEVDDQNANFTRFMCDRAGSSNILSAKETQIFVRQLSSEITIGIKLWIDRNPTFVRQISSDQNATFAST